VPFRPIARARGAAARHIWNGLTAEGERRIAPELVTPNLLDEFG
jgi:hypothetical protein